jgi:hypothetical protein
MTPERWLRECPFGRWIKWEDVPTDMFVEIFDLIDNRFLGWLYYFDEFDQGFQKNLPYKANSYDQNSYEREQTRERHRQKTRERYDREMANRKLGESG